MTSKNIREDIEHNMYVSGVVEVEISNPQEAFELLIKGRVISVEFYLCSLKKVYRFEKFEIEPTDVEVQTFLEIW